MITILKQSLNRNTLQVLEAFYITWNKKSLDWICSYHIESQLGPNTNTYGYIKNTTYHTIPPEVNLFNRLKEPHTSLAGGGEVSVQFL